MVRLISNQARGVPLPVFIALIIMSWIAFKPLPAWLVGTWFLCATGVMVSRYLTLNDPKVRIRRGALGAFYLEFEKVNHSPRVRRVQ